MQQSLIRLREGQIVNAETAIKLAEVLIQLQLDFPLFFKDVADDDPDMDLEKGFETYEKLRQEHAD